MAKAILAILKKATKAFILASTVIYIAASLTSYINPIYCSIFTFLALGFPFILLVMLFAVLLAFFCFKKYAWIFVGLLLIGTKNIIATTGFHPFAADFKQEKPKGTIRLLSWNVNSFESSEIKNDTFNNNRRKIFAFIKESNADIICLQDFRDFFNDGRYYSNSKYLIDTLKYRYIYMAVDHFEYTAAGDVSGTAILSKFAILDTGRITYNSKINPEHIGYADIDLGNKKRIRFYNTHLSSMQLTAERRSAGLNYTYLQDDTAILLNKSKIERIAIFDSFHVKQAQLVKEQLDRAPKPFVFCADLNSVPSSFVYHHINSGLQDAFLQKGFGWGSTYDGLSHTLRIDVTLLSPEIKVLQHYSPRIKASDHFPLITDIALP